MFSTGFEITFAPELAQLAAPSAGERPETAATWDSGDAMTGAAITTPALITAKSPSPIDRISPKPSGNEKKRFSFLKRTSVQENAAGFTALPQVNGRPSREAYHSPKVSQTTNGNGFNPNDRAGAMSPASNNEEKLQKYFGIPESQYRVASPEPRHEVHARTASNHNQNQMPSAPATGQYNATIAHASPPLSQQEIERPGTRQSSRSTQDTGASKEGGSSIGSRVGSVKKRLSILGIGKKASKSSVRSRGQPESLIEE